MPDSPAADSIGLREAVSIGVGGMVGGGIFAVLGLAADVGRGGTWVAFAIAGAVAALTGYSYSKLSVAVPSDGGTVTFLNTAFGRGAFAGAFNVALWLAYIVTSAMYAYAFGSYGARLFGGSGAIEHLLITAVVVATTLLNVVDASIVGEAEEYIVGAKIAILVAFVGYALFQADLSANAPSQWPPVGTLAAGGMLIFVAYEGFELIANSSNTIRSPRRNLPRAYAISIGATIVLYMLVAVVVVGLMSVADIRAAQDVALAEAARVVWGQVGYVLIIVAALLSTASAINATLFGTTRLTVDIAVDGELPSELERKVAGKPILGLLITSLVAGLMANLVPLDAISTVASAAFLAIFAVTNLANAKLAERTHSSRWISLIATAGCVAALVALMANSWGDNRLAVWLTLAVAVLCVAVERVYRARRTNG